MRFDRLTPSAAAVVRVVLAALVYAVLQSVLKVLPRYDCIVFVAGAYGIFRLLDEASPRARTATLYVVTPIFVASYLLHLWTLGYEGRNAVFGGIIPWSDSHDFYEDALRLAHGVRFTEISSRRPLFAAVLSVLLKTTGGNLHVSLAVCAIVGALAIALATSEVWKTHGWKSALVVWLVLVFFERRWAGFVQTEHLGFPLGLVGFSLIWRANALVSTPTAHRRARWLVLAGIFALTTGLMARAGAFFVLPAIALWGARTFVPRRPARMGFLALAFVALVLGFAVHKGVLSATGKGVTFSDYPGIFYGMMHGEDYTFLAERHPEINGLSAAERVPLSWHIVIAEAKANPVLVVTGFLKSGLGLFTSPFGMFSYVWTNPDDHVLENGEVVRAAMAEHGLLGPLILWRRTLGTYSLFNAGAMGALGGAFVLSVIVAGVRIFFRKERHEPSLSLLRWVIAGVVVSAPFTPPWITSGQQVQTVTLAFVAALPGVVLFGSRRDRAGVAESPAPASLFRIDPLAFVPIGFVACLALALAWEKATPWDLPVCAGGAPEERVLYLSHDSFTEVVPTRSMSIQRKGLDDLHVSIAFLSRHNPGFVASLTPYLRTSTRYVNAFDACDQRLKVVVDDARVLPDPESSSWTKVTVEPLRMWNVVRARAVAGAPPSSVHAPVQAPVDP